MTAARARLKERPRLRAALWLVAAAALWTCGVVVLTPSVDAVPFRSEPAVVATLSEGRLSTRVLLVGDAGLLDPGAPLMRHVAQRTQKSPEKTAVVFLGDNIYPAGLPAETSSDRTIAEGRLRAQLAPLVGVGASVIFVPGNHDWDNSGPDGEQRVLRQEHFVHAAGPDFEYLPRRAEPGPECLDFQGVRLVALDTQWWLHQHARPKADPARVLEALRQCVRDSKRPVVVLTHHPPVSHGPHGGLFTAIDHLVPLHAARPWAYIPLPILGSLYVWSRHRGVSPQDISHPNYRAMIDKFTAVLGEQRPLLWAAGHEHSLLLERGHPAADFVLVSGSGSRASVTSHGNNSLFSAASPGFAELEIGADGTAFVTFWGAQVTDSTPLWATQLRP